MKRRRCPIDTPCSLRASLLPFGSTSFRFGLQHENVPGCVRSHQGLCSLGRYLCRIIEIADVCALCRGIICKIDVCAGCMAIVAAATHSAPDRSTGALAAEGGSKRLPGQPPAFLMCGVPLPLHSDGGPRVPNAALTLAGLPKLEAGAGFRSICANLFMHTLTLTQNFRQKQMPHMCAAHNTHTHKKEKKGRTESNAEPR